MFLQLHNLLVSLALHVCDCTLSSFLSVHFTTHTHVHKTQSDPILGAAFFQSDVYTQAVLVPVFFLFRAAFEYIADAITSSTFGSDGMPVINYFGVLMHEVCLAMMITSIKHPLVFVSLILSDLAENTFCLWSLSALRLSYGKVSPSAEGKEDEETKQNQRDANSALVRQKSYIQRSTSVFTLLRDRENLSDRGTALFIAATLLQREMIETFVPIQAAGVLSFLYTVLNSSKSNSIVVDWEDSDYVRSMIYISIDVVAEIFVFFLTSTLLSRIYPEFKSWRILFGLLRTHWLELFMVTTGAWMTVLLMQTTYSGLDMTFQFEWLNCNDDDDDVNTTSWMGGFHWDC